MHRLKVDKARYVRAFIITLNKIHFLYIAATLVSDKGYEVWYTAHKYVAKERGEMNFFDIVFVLLTATWIGEFVMKRGKQSTSGSSTEKRSFLLILFMISTSIVATLLLNELQLFLFDKSALTNAIGLLLYGGGIALRYWGIQELGHFFSRNVIVESKVDLVSSGPYRILRHPLYTGLLLTTIGIPLYIGAWGGVIVAVLLITPALLFRIRLEEKMLYDSVGESYREWGRERYRLVPYIY